MTIDTFIIKKWVIDKKWKYVKDHSEKAEGIYKILGELTKYIDAYEETEGRDIEKDYNNNH